MIAFLSRGSTNYCIPRCNGIWPRDTRPFFPAALPATPTNMGKRVWLARLQQFKVANTEYLMQILCYLTDRLTDKIIIHLMVSATSMLTATGILPPWRSLKILAILYNTHYSYNARVLRSNPSRPQTLVAGGLIVVWPTASPSCKQRSAHTQTKQTGFIFQLNLMDFAQPWAACTVTDVYICI